MHIKILQGFLQEVASLYPTTIFAQLFIALYNCLENQVAWITKSRSTIRNEENVEAIRQLVEKHPQVSERNLQQELDLPYDTYRHILKHDLNLHRQRLQATHEILSIVKPKQYNNLLAGSHLSGHVNSLNMRI